VTLSAAGAAAADGPIVAGLASQDEHVLASYDPSRRTVSIEVRSEGRTRTVRRKKVTLPDRFGFAFVLCENQVTVLVDTRDGTHDRNGVEAWRPLLTERRKVAQWLDLRVPETLAGLRYAWGSKGLATPAAVSDVQAGLFGMAGLRDPHLVQHADGTPYVHDGRMYLTASCAGMGFFQQAHWGVFRLDLEDPRRLEQTAQLFFERDGLLLGDHAGQVVRDGDEWIVATSSWGDFDFDGVHVRHTRTTEDVLHGVHVLRTERTPLPTDVGCWDPALTRIDDVWHVAFVESPSQKPFDFHPALAVGSPGGAWHEDLRLIGAAKDLHQCEGPILARIDDRWWLLASDGDGRGYPVFTTQMHRVGRLDAPYPTNIPHPQLVPLPDGGFLMVTFDGTQYGEKVLGYGGHGDVLVMRSVG
jgi:hypothetical protein